MVLAGLFKSKDPRDKVFAVLGITSDGDKLPFKPNYNDPIELVFLKTTAFIYSSEDWFSMFNFTGRGYPTVKYTIPLQFQDSLLSWVPDYSSGTKFGSRAIIAEKVQSRDTAGQITPTANPRVIQTQAVNFDVIKHSGPMAEMLTSSILLPNPNAPSEAIREQICQFLSSSMADGRAWYLASQHLARKYSVASQSSQEIADQHFWELCMRQGEYSDSTEKPPGLYPPLSAGARRLFEFFFLTDLEVLMSHPANGVLGEKISMKEALEMYLFLARKFGLTIEGKALAVTAKGLMALVPPLARDGDLLVHVRGGYTPVVLRRKAAGERTAELVGTCIVLLSRTCIPARTGRIGSWSSKGVESIKVYSHTGKGRSTLIHAPKISITIF
jgi:hypothetical protein